MQFEKGARLTAHRWQRRQRGRRLNVHADQLMGIHLVVIYLVVIPLIAIDLHAIRAVKGLCYGR